jgi:hypothetical protein
MHLLRVTRLQGAEGVERGANICEGEGAERKKTGREGAEWRRRLREAAGAKTARGLYGYQWTERLPVTAPGEPTASIASAGSCWAFRVQLF